MSSQSERKYLAPGFLIPDFAIGSDRWPGLAKLAEENGELSQVIGKLMAYPNLAVEHPDGAGPLDVRLMEEMADLQAAIMFVRAHNFMPPGFEQRVQEKFDRFQRWDGEERRRVG